MNICAFKDLIKQNKLQFTCLIFEFSGLDVVVKQYIQAISKNQASKIIYVDDILSIPTTDIFEVNTNTNNLYICKLNSLDNLEGLHLAEWKNVIILTDNINKQLKQNLISQNYLIEFPKLEPWHIVEYIKTMCPGLEAQQAEHFYNMLSNNWDVLMNEVDKLSQFDKAIQAELFDSMVNEGCFLCYDSLLPYKISNAILKRNLVNVMQLSSSFNSDELDPFLFLNIFKKSLRRVIDVQLTPGVTADKLGLNYKQFKAIQYNCNKYAQKELAELYKFVCDIDFQIKAGIMIVDNKQLKNILLCKLSENCL